MLEINAALGILMTGNIFLLVDYNSMDFDLGIGVFSNCLDVPSIPVGEF